MALRREVLSPTLREFFLAVLAMLPSRNYVVQILRLLYETGGVDIDTFKQTYRGIVDDYVEDLLYRLGVVTEKNIVRLKYMSPGWIIASMLDEVFDILEDPEAREKFSEASGLEITDPFEEWLFVRLDTVLKDPAHGENAKIVLRNLAMKNTVTSQELVEQGLNIGESYTIGDILKYLGIAEHIDGIIRLTPIIIDKRDRFERVLRRLGVVE